MIKRDIFLYGPPGSGKSTTGKRLAQSLHLPFVDLDEEIERAQGQSITQIFAAEGEAAFRRYERKALLTLPETETGIVISLGGGALIHPENQQWVETRGVIVFLETCLPNALERLSQKTQTRPLLTGNLEETLANLFQERAGHYASFDLRVTTDNLCIEELVWQIQILLGRFQLDAMGSYSVSVQAGGFKDVGVYLSSIASPPLVALVSDENVGKLYAGAAVDSLRTAGFEVFTILVAPGEANKTIHTIATLWDQMLSHGMGRDGLVLALGGGVVSDLAGFAAATYLRGVPWAVVPTTLLSMADASLGGKTGIDLPGGKNLAGAFHPPRFVLADTNLLSSLPEEEWRSGMAEIVKHGIIGDPQLFALCSNLPVAHIMQTPKAILLEIVRRAMAVKIKIIENDPYEKGERAALNLGHTIGHAVEQASHFQLRHGEAVAVGLVQEARLAETLQLADAGLSNQIAHVLTRLGLPVEVPLHLSPTEVEKAIMLDKKKKNGKVQFALPVEIGKVQTGIEISLLSEYWR